jgi:hypothetical protein
MHVARRMPGAKWALSSEFDITLHVFHTILLSAIYSLVQFFILTSASHFELRNRSDIQ